MGYGVSIYSYNYFAVRNNLLIHTVHSVAGFRVLLELDQSVASWLPVLQRHVAVYHTSVIRENVSNGTLAHFEVKVVHKKAPSIY